MKTIESPTDLAINGAPPAFHELIHVGRPHVGNRESFMKYAGDIFDRRWLTNNGPLVQQLEQNVSQHHGVKHCVAMCNGTIALEIAIRALGLAGEVIIPSYTFIATAHALSWQGLTPVFADIDTETHNIDPAAVRRMITPRTTGIIGVHLWGRAAPVEELQALSDEYGLSLLFDAAHAFGCSYGRQMVGNFGACEVLSFHATKFFNAFEGGAVLTNDDHLAETMRLMRNFGFAGLDNVIHPGTNGKMTEISAAMGLVNFDAIDDIIATNRRNYLLYLDGLSNVPGVKLLTFNEEEINNYQYIVIEVQKESRASRDEIVNALHAENIRARKYFWPGCHRMQPYNELFPHSGLLLPNTQLVSDRTIVLPTGEIMDSDKIAAVVAIVRIMVE